ncbi:endonuclease/exonuclease/phosphatase family protein [Vibrio sinensis]|uniref:Endonuclease/exonuclease/phosphatase family protein n=1 Tax=Vibrio sinensis TaxID=2302434 RepID=A0A3A6REL7_9VIBR|nr:endonuclease/exonuclease/phosphatase family protein [Vibrio sinensis]RJX75111.1 endonuclease/exonuclease/phosphatase family protein [Vibrio sinensis]
MITDKTLTFASANLFNFIEPPGAFYDFENIYESDAWQEKCRWIALHFEQLNADVVGVQEVFSVEAARALFETLGYPHFACIDEPHIESEYIYSQPVVALASKYPITFVETVTPPTIIEQNYSTVTPKFSRKPLSVIIDVPEIGEVAVYVCHLKSQRATDSVSPDYSHQMIGQWLSSQQRGWEALMLRVFMEQSYQKHPIPTVLMGDMNQPLVSDITGLLTHNIEQPPQRLKLQDSWDIFSLNKPEIERSPTHYHFAKGNVLDYILLSQEFQPNSQYSMAEVTAYQVLDQHLINPIYERDKQASDHAFVGITVRFVL